MTLLHFKFLQSKSLNSDSGVLFSPPSIVKDALGDSGLLMDSNMSTHVGGHMSLVDETQPQVHSQSSVKSSDVYPFAISTQTQPNEMYHTYTKDELYTTTSSNTQSHLLQINQTKSDLVENHLPSTVLPTISAKPSTVYPNHTHPSTILKQKHPKEPTFNPYADENDRSANHFQLSKTSAEYPAKTNSNNHSTKFVESTPFARTFGFNRTNIIWNGAPSGLIFEAQPSGTLATHLHTSPNVSRFQIRTNSLVNRSPNSESNKSQAFRPLLPDNAGKSKSPFRTSISQPMTFKCFDLSDEAGWLNFDQ